MHSKESAYFYGRLIASPAACAYISYESILTIFCIWGKVFTKHIFKNSYMWDPRYKQEYLDRGQNWINVTGEDHDADDNDIRLEARDCRYSCWIRIERLRD